MCADWNVSIRRACRVLRFDTSTYHYKSRRRDQAGSRLGSRRSAQTRVRYGYRRVHVMLRREGWDQPQEDLPDLQGVGPATEEQDTEAAGEGEAAGGPQRGDAAERDLGDGLRPRPAGDRPQDPRPDGRRHLLALLAGDRSAVQLSRRGRGAERWTRSAPRSAIRRRSASTRAREFVSRDLDLWAYTRGVTLDFSPAGQSRPTMRSSKPSTAASGRSA